MAYRKSARESFNEQLSQAKKASEGQWRLIFSQVLSPAFPNIDQAMDNGHSHVAVLGEIDDFRFIPGWESTGIASCNKYDKNNSILIDGFNVINFLLGLNGMTQAIKLVNQVVNNEHFEPILKVEKTPSEIAKQKKAEAFKRKLFKDTISTCQPIDLNDDNPSTRYLISRGIDLNSLNGLKDVLYCDELEHYEKGKPKVKMPAIVHLMRNKEGVAINAQRIFLQESGSRAAVKNPKQLFPVTERISGSASKLFDIGGDTLHVAEGFETALSVRNILEIWGIKDQSVWATNNANNLASLQIDPAIKTLHIWADLDRSFGGQNAAETLQSRMESQGIEVLVHYPLKSLEEIPSGEKGIDFNDILTDRFQIYGSVAA